MKRFCLFIDGRFAEAKKAVTSIPSTPAPARSSLRRSRSSLPRPRRPYKAAYGKVLERPGCGARPGVRGGRSRLMMGFADRTMKPSLHLALL
jgi:hypothetical protein